MRFALTEEQTDLVATVHTLIAKRAASMDLRAAIATPEGYDTALWQTLSEQIGVTALAVPEAYGGVGCSYLEAHLVLEELGARLTPSPFVGTLLASQALTAADTPAAHELLERIAGGATAALASAPQPVDLTDRSVRSTTPPSARPVLDGPILDGLALDAPGAEILLLVADGHLYSLDPNATEVTPAPALDPTLRLAHLPPTAPTGATPIGTVDPTYITTVGTTLMTALQAGAAREALERTVAYLKERHQFGRPLGSFQALKHRCADLLVQVETARTMSWAAAWELTQPTPDRELIGAAKTWCSDAFSQVAAEMIQLHGGVAITWEHDAHLYFKRAHATAQLWKDVHAR